MLQEDILWVTDHMRTKAEETMGLQAEDWHALPVPPEQRPRPR